ncbi:molybdate ABC transporter substrate-binding protein [Dictyobacter arantiisoli]|uniref:Molybdenum ABC transporter substrate-binding protein n=1 Tax=Dictyobacter arantiisoli TaxID=2014874 RepID=A0A5A5T6H4_9CHLR|nr:molybdate ABC transporter substrate-binding protein [Dictyobacter arantiisoli]GCF06825.1 molybdenum ABC transporter substrate-binding protein [Dictyobacter arantiisoli]
MKFAGRLFPLVLIILLLLLAACGESSPTATSSTTTTPSTSSSSAVSLNVFAASSLTESFNAIKTAYHTSHPDVSITYNFNGSQALEQQIANGAEADVFASADQINMQKAIDAGVVTQSQNFARNKLVVIIPNSNPGHITSLKDLAKAGTKIVLGAPAVPVGKYSLQVLDKLGKSSAYGVAYEKSVRANIVSQEENVKAVVQKVQLGEADAGIVYLTDVTSAASTKVETLTIPDQDNVIAQYPVAVTKNSAHAQTAHAFITYLLSADGQAILTKYHFIAINSI